MAVVTEMRTCPVCKMPGALVKWDEQTSQGYAQSSARALATFSCSRGPHDIDEGELEQQLLRGE